MIMTQNTPITDTSQKDQSVGNSFEGSPLDYLKRSTQNTNDQSVKIETPDFIGDITITDDDNDNDDNLENKNIQHTGGIKKVEPLKIDSVDVPDDVIKSEGTLPRSQRKALTVDISDKEHPAQTKSVIPKEISDNQEFQKEDQENEKNPFLEIQKSSREIAEENNGEEKSEIVSMEQMREELEDKNDSNEGDKISSENIESDKSDISKEQNTEDYAMPDVSSAKESVPEIISEKEEAIETQVHNLKIQDEKTEIVVPKEKAKTGFLAGLKNKWETHKAKNKKKAEARKASKNSDNLDDVKIEKKNMSKEEIEKITEDDANLAELFENYNPETDRKKLTPKLRQQIIEAEKFYNDGIVNIKDLISPTSMTVTPKHLELNNMHVKSYYVYNYPRYLEANWLNQIINFDATLDISLFVYPTDSAKMMKILRKKVTQMRASRHMRADKGFTNDVALETALEDAEQLRVDLQRGKERLFQVGVYFTVYAKDKNKLEVMSKQVETILGGLLVLTRSGDFQTERCFNTTLPQCTDEIQVFRNMNTAPLSTTFPFVSNTLTSNEGILYGLNRHNNSLIIFDRFNLENANSVIFAKSGAGKSYTVKLEVLRSMMMGTDVIIIDPEKEYETLTNTIGGTYVNISLNSKHRINPFDLPLSIESDGESNTKSLLRENIITLSGLMNLMLGKLNPEESSIMDKALFQTYEIKGITEEITNPRDYEMPTMIDLEKILESMEGGKGLAMRLEKYTTGTFSGLFSKHTNVDMNSGLLCFGIRDLEEMLRPIAMHILLNYIWNRVRSKLKKRMLVIDEAWNLVQYEDSGRFLHNLCKRSRKYYLGISTITQDVEDFLGSKWGKPIITNSSLQILLRQSPTAVDKLKQIFYLTEQEKYLLLNSNIGQGLFFAGNQHVAIQIIASYGEHKIVTTNPKDLLENKEESVQDEDDNIEDDNPEEIENNSEV